LEDKVCPIKGMTDSSEVSVDWNTSCRCSPETRECLHAGFVAG